MLFVSTSMCPAAGAFGTNRPHANQADPLGEPQVPNATGEIDGLFGIALGVGDGRPVLADLAERARRTGCWLVAVKYRPGSSLSVLRLADSLVPHSLRRLKQKQNSVRRGEHIREQHVHRSRFGRMPAGVASRGVDDSLFPPDTKGPFRQDFARLADCGAVEVHIRRLRRAYHRHGQYDPDLLEEPPLDWNLPSCPAVALRDLAPPGALEPPFHGLPKRTLSADSNQGFSTGFGRGRVHS